MAKIKLNTQGGVVYSTDPDFKLSHEVTDTPQTLLPSFQQLKIRLDTKHRAGKAVTLIEGFVGSRFDREELGKKVKTACGTGGSVKDDNIIVQGDNRDKIFLWLQKNGYSSVKKR